MKHRSFTVPVLVALSALGALCGWPALAAAQVDYYSNGARATTLPKSGPGAEFYRNGARVNMSQRDGARVNTVPSADDPGGAHFHNGAHNSINTQIPTGDEPGADYYRNGARVMTVPESGPAAEFYRNGAHSTVMSTAAYRSGGRALTVSNNDTAAPTPLPNQADEQAEPSEEAPADEEAAAEPALDEALDDEAEAEALPPEADDEHAAPTEDEIPVAPEAQRAPPPPAPEPEPEPEAPEPRAPDWDWEWEWGPWYDGPEGSSTGEPLDPTWGRLAKWVRVTGVTLAGSFVVLVALLGWHFTTRKRRRDASGEKKKNEKSAPP